MLKRLQFNPIHFGNDIQSSEGAGPWYSTQLVAQQKLRTQQEALTKPWLGAGLRFMKGDWHLNFEIKWVPRAKGHKT